VGGYADVEARLLRLIGEPEARYREDPVRMLRAARLAAKLGFTIEPATAEPIARLAPLLADASSARLFEETLKLFLSGHAVASFEHLEAHGLLPALLPDTAKALASNKSGALRRMLVQGLRNTDARVDNDEPVSPAFLYAVLLWPAYCRALAELQAQGVHAAEAQRRAADRVTMHQVARTALPRRFSLPMQEIWLMQPRFSLRQRKRVFRMLAHPRFRAAVDFLELRLAASDAHADDVAFWREAQLQPAATVAAEESSGEADDAISGEDAPAARRRRRRRRS
jgi:poly(A) polymerase